MEQPAFASTRRAVPVPGGFEGVHPEDVSWAGVRHVFLHNLPARVTETKFREFLCICEAPGPQQLHFPTYANGKSRGYASMTFNTVEERHAFVTALWGKRIPGFRKQLPLACEPSIRRPEGTLRQALARHGFPRGEEMLPAGPCGSGTGVFGSMASQSNLSNIGMEERQDDQKLGHLFNMVLRV
mmetsp:Transcript_42261/g.98614  ORF Transcript_42261/g.98614 Transcript_42261/m.98614 type:complete len:184 (+) Transcript_42261:55-606(+)